MLTPGTYTFGPDNATLRLHTFREGMARKVGHDLILEVTEWSATAEVAEDVAASSVVASFQPASIAVIEGRGGVKPLSDGDRADIKKNINKVLQTSKFPEATFQSTKVDTQSEGRVTLFGDLTLVGNTRAVSIDVQLEPEPGATSDRATATTTIVQSEWGIKPYTGLMGTLKVRDAVELHVDATVPHA